MKDRKRKDEHTNNNRFPLPFVEQSIQGIIILQDFRIIYTDQAFADISGYSIDELLSLSRRKVRGMIHPDHQAMVWGRMKARLQGKEVSARYEYKGLKKDGSVIWLEMVASRSEHNGKPVIKGAVIDITERKLAEESLKASEERYLALFHRSLFGVYIHDFEGKFLDANEAALEMLGYKKQDISTLNFASILEAQQLPEAFKVVEEIVRKGYQEEPTLYRIRRKNGRHVWVETEATLIYKNGKPFAIQGIARDVTKYKEAEEALRESEEKYRAIFESFHDVYYRTDKDGIITLISPSVRTHAGWEPEEVIGHPVTDFYQDPNAREVFREKLREKGVINDYELKLLAKDGRVIDVSLSSQIIRGTDGSPKGVEGVLRDITDRKKVEEQIKTSLKEKEVLLQEIHHRVKNNMQIISSLINLQSWQIEDPKVKNMFQMSRDRIRSMALIHEKLYQSKDLAGINFAQYIQSLTVHLMHTYNAKLKNVHLKTEVENVFLDISKAIPCGLIINELVTNSLKHAFPDGQSGEILVRLHTNNNGKMALEVSDTGVGFPDGSNVRKPDTLGLQLVNDLVNQLGGIIELDQTRGTAFRVAFDRTQDAE